MDKRPFWGKICLLLGCLMGRLLSQRLGETLLRLRGGASAGRSGEEFRDKYYETDGDRCYYKEKN